MPIRLATIRTKHLYVTNGGGGARLEYATPISFLVFLPRWAKQGLLIPKSHYQQTEPLQFHPGPICTSCAMPVHRKNVGGYDRAVTWILVPFSGEASRRSAEAFLATCQARGTDTYLISKLEKSSDEVEDVKDDRPIGPAYERSTFWPRV
jgi:hypothetical protein